MCQYCLACDTRRNKIFRLVKFMSKNILSLSGNWRVDYLSSAPYTEVTEPVISDTSDSVTTIPVPGYWEDMKAAFSKAPFFGNLKINPEYGAQSYPIAGVAPDMALPNIMGTFFYRRRFVLPDMLSRSWL